jgi:hypothetical protein
MKSIKEALSEAMPNFYRFPVFTVDNGKKNKTVGMAYLRDGQGIYSLRLWMFLEDKFFLLPSREDSSEFLLMTREINKTNSSQNKFFWNIVGNAKADVQKGVIELNFDLLEKKIYMSLYPDESANPFGKTAPDEGLAAA